MSILSILLACTQPSSDTSTERIDYSVPGSYSIGHRKISVDELQAELWYPASETIEGQSVASAFLEDTQVDIYNQLLAAAPCASTQTTAGKDAPELEGSFPLIIFSHCHECTRFSGFTIAEQLASHGFIVAAIDHKGNSLWEQLENTGLPLSTGTLTIRVEQHHALLDMALELENIDPERIGAFGHSFGSVTTGMIAQERPEIKAALGLAAPMENPLLSGVNVSELRKPLGFLIAVEDNSISEFGNELMRTNFEDAEQAWKLEVPDAGHWSFSDIVGLIENFEPGCGEDLRQTDGTVFQYIDAIEGRNIAAGFSAAFFAQTLLGDEDALNSLGWAIENH
jgi:dienelactone hydrolase|tara:strand:+ start:240 stop:1256 length:1017 start_codon:yes stop_codon:yes gene_type:complete